MNKTFPMNNIWPRAALALFGVLLSIQAAWILLADRDQIRQAASFAGVRGDLWAKSALSYGYHLRGDHAMDLNAEDKFDPDAIKAMTQTLKYSPHRGDVWLMFAALADQYKLPEYQPLSLLKMSYYTAPNELALFPLRLNLSLHAKGLIDDPEIQDMVRRDITVVLTHAPAVKPALVAAYASAPPQARIFAERVIAEIDPGYLGVVRARDR